MLIDWLVAMRQVFNHLDNVACFYCPWAAGFREELHLGMFIEERLAMGAQIIRIISNEDITALIDAKSRNQGLQIVDGQGAVGLVKLILQ